MFFVTTLTLATSPSQPRFARQLSQRESLWRDRKRYHYAKAEPSQAHFVRQLPRKGELFAVNRQMLKSSPLGNLASHSHDREGFPSLFSIDIRVWLAYTTFVNTD